MPEFTAIAHGFPEHPKVMGLHDRAFRFHITALDYCSRNLTDGHVSDRAVKVVAAIMDTTAKRWPRELVAAGLWRADTGGDGYQIHDYLTYNPSAESMKQLRDKRRQAGIRGAERRWRGAPAADNDKPHGKPDGKRHGKEQIPAEQSRALDLLTSSSGRHSPENDLPETITPENEFLVAKLMRAIGDHADVGTRLIVASYAVRLPPASLAKVAESLELNAPQDRAAYAVAALKGELAERSAA